MFPLILCVGHEPYDKVIIEEMLRDVTPRVDCAFVPNAEEMVNALNKRIPRLILGELDECATPSCKALLKLRHDAALRHIPFVVFTARAGSGIIRFSYENGANSVVGKPTDLDSWRLRMAALIRYWMETAECCEDSLLERAPE